MSNQLPPTNGEQEKLPFEPFTLMKALWLRRWVMLLIVLLATGLGLGTALLFGKRIYHAQTIMLYRPGASGTLEEKNAALKTLLNLVKIEANLREVRKRLNLESTLAEIGQALAVYEQGETNMVIIRAQWTDADTSAKLANTLRDVFLNFLEERKQRLSSQPDRQQAELNLRLAEAENSLKQADDKLDAFITINQVVDLEKQVQWMLEEKTNLGFVYQKATVEKRTLDLQMENLDRIIKELGAKAGQEIAGGKATEDLGELNIRFRRLRDAIHDDRWNRAQAATLAQLEGEYRRTKRLYEKGVATKVEFEKTKNSLDRQKALSVDTPQIKQWKADISKLDKIVIPKKGGSTGPSAKLLHQMMLRYFDVQLQHVAMGAKTSYLASALEKVQERLNKLTKLQRQLVNFKRDVTAAEKDRKTLESLLSKLKTTQHPAASQLELLSVARPPIRRTHSNRKLIAIGITGGLSFLGLVILLLIELTNPTIRSSQELILKLSLPVLGQVPDLDADHRVLPNCHEPTAVEQMKIVARRLRTKLPQKGAKVLIASALQKEGRSFVAANLAAYLGRRDERVLLVEIVDEQLDQVEPTGESTDLSHLLLEGPAEAGLGEYLNLLAEAREEIIYPTCLAGVDLLPAGKESIEVELMARERMKTLLAELSEIYSVIILDSPPALAGEAAVTVAASVNGVILVVQAGKTKKGELMRTLARLSEKGSQTVGAVLNRVRPPFDEVRGI